VQHRTIRPRRLQAALLACALLAACGDGEEQTIAPTPSPVVAPTSTAAPTPEPTATPTPAPTVDAEAARLEELRASDAFVELAEHDRAATAPNARFAWDEFTLSTNDAGVREEWRNKAELWDQLMPAFRDECLLAGEPATRPIWDGQIMIPVGISPRWSDDATEGRGQFLQALCVYEDAESRVVERWMGALLSGPSNAEGEVLAVMPAVEFSEIAVSTVAERESRLRALQWEWIKGIGR
jgi:hypothetical protein